MKRTSLDAGKRGEDLAVAYLKKHGFKILERNFRIRGGEIDIIAIDSSAGVRQATLVFIEVKTRSSLEFGTPLESITRWKLKALVRTAYVYKTKYPTLPGLMRIDAVAVTLNAQNEVEKIDLVKNIS